MTYQPLVERPTNAPAESFREMAQAIEHNKDQGFGGAVVIVPPAGGGENIEILMLDSRADIAQFWSTIQTRITLRLGEIDQKSRGAFGGR